eukprot:7386882-Prymnesium_polylepis.1
MQLLATDSVDNDGAWAQPPQATAGALVSGRLVVICAQGPSRNTFGNHLLGLEPALCHLYELLLGCAYPAPCGADEQSDADGGRPGKTHRWPCRWAGWVGCQRHNEERATNDGE